MTPKIFVSYNSGVEVEQSTALRLQTLSSLYNAKIYLPDRSGKSLLKDTTKQRILDSYVFVLFSTSPISKEVHEEINFALANKKKVIVFYEKSKGKNLNTSNIKDKTNFIEQTFDPKETTANELLDYVVKHGGLIREKEKDSGAGKVVLALLGVGLGLLLLNALTDDDDED